MDIGKMAVGGFALGSVITIFWNYLKLLALKITGLFIIRINIRSNSLKMAICTLITKEFKLFRVGSKKYSAHLDYVRTIQKNLNIGYEDIPTEPTVYFRNYRPLLFSVRDSDIVISFLRWCYDPDSLIIEALNKYNETNNRKDWMKGDRFFVRTVMGNLGNRKSEGRNRNQGAGTTERPVEANTTGMDFSWDTCRILQYKREEIGLPKKTSPMGNMCLTKGAKEAVKDGIKWRNSEEWFKSKNIPWKRGQLLFGSPGTGKTAFVRAIGQELNMPIFSFDLATMNNQDFIEKWDDAMSYCPLIILFEDIDAIFEGRKNVAVKGMESGLTFDCFLNKLDGVENTDGIFIIITTNDITKIDPAIGIPTNGNDMSSRPGRIDRTIEFKPLDKEGKAKMAERILSDFPKDKWQYLLDEEKDRTGAQFQDMCSRLAMKLWDQERGDIA